MFFTCVRSSRKLTPRSNEDEAHRRAFYSRLPQRRAPGTLPVKFRANKIPSRPSREQKAHLRAGDVVQPLFGFTSFCRLSPTTLLTSSTGHPLLQCVLFSAVQSGCAVFHLVLFQSLTILAHELAPQCSPFFPRVVFSSSTLGIRCVIVDFFKITYISHTPRVLSIILQRIVIDKCNIFFRNCKKRSTHVVYAPHSLLFV